MNTIIYLINSIYSVIVFLILVRAVISWISPGIYNSQWRRLLKVIFNLTEPVLAPIRKYIPSKYAGIDFSPVIALIALSIINRFLINLVRYILIDIQSIF